MRKGELIQLTYDAFSAFGTYRVVLTPSYLSNGFWCLPLARIANRQLFETEAALRLTMTLFDQDDLNVAVSLRDDTAIDQLYAKARSGVLFKRKGVTGHGNHEYVAADETPLVLAKAMVEIFDAYDLTLRSAGTRQTPLPALCGDILMMPMLTWRSEEL